MTGTWLSLAAMLAVSGLDRRFGWSSVPTAICLDGAVLVAVGQVVMIQTADMNAIQIGCCAAIGADVETEPDGLTLQELHFPPDTP